ncbi:hypothetical protein OH77DRAFT_1427857 [Trametes cingulata]|nr:hypothetical protein OH77DRAFT_1427857 [Trametes cingulata]
MTTPIDEEPPPLPPPPSPSLLSLPADISLHVLAYLSLNDLYHLRLVCKRIHGFFEAHEETIYHQAAIYHRFVRSQTSLEDAALTTGQEWLYGVQDWKELCRRWTTLERNWSGHGFVREGGFRPSEDNVISYVVDEEQNTVISLSRKGGLVVRAIEDSRCLWALSSQYVATTRCGMSHGFLVFMAKDSGLEIWRRAADASSAVLRRRGQVVTTPVVAPSPAAIRDFQVQAGVLAPVARESNRGHFVPHAYVDTTHDIGPVRLFRVKYPLLAYIGFRSPSDVAVVDVTSGEVVWCVSVGTGPMRGMSPLFAFPPDLERMGIDIDLSREHLCLCMYSVVVVYRLPKHCTSESYESGTANADANENPPVMLVLGEMDTHAARQTTAHLLMLSAADRTEPAPVPIHSAALPVLATARGRDVLERFDIVPPSLSSQRANMHALVPAGGPRPEAAFMCARFSPDGKHIVVGTNHGLLYFAWDFARVEQGMLFTDITEYLLIDEPLRDLSWDSDVRRLALRTISGEVFIVTLNSSHYDGRSTGEAPERPTIANDATAYRLLDFSNHVRARWARGQGLAFTSLQMTRTALWLVWDVGLLAHSVAKREARAVGERRVEPASGECSGALGFPSVDDERLDIDTDCDEEGYEIHSVCFIDFTPGM